RLKEIIMGFIAMLLALALALLIFAMNTGGEEMAMPYSRKAVLSRFLAQSQVKPKSASCSTQKHVCKQNDIRGEVKSRCCKNRCYNVLRDRYNCGSCGRSCSFGRACCNGKCIDVAYNKNNCGNCGVRCRKHQKCRYGMCSYA
ncbi:hypothetical protein KI387_024593, partial [Taxus chinensis]